jgi:hypothetical protein
MLLGISPDGAILQSARLIWTQFLRNLGQQDESILRSATFGHGDPQAHCHRASRQWYLMKKELFICDDCSARTRLNRAERHWCTVCNRGAPVEMRHVRDKKPSVANTTASLVSPIGGPSKVRQFSTPGQISVGVRAPEAGAQFRFPHSAIIEKRN